MAETIEYEVVKNWGAVEVRRYPPLVLATVNSSYDDIAFSILFKYISGYNEAGGKLAMTAPVISPAPGERIAMTAPVLSDDEGFSFVLPSGTDIANAPRPLDARVTLSAVPSRFVAALRFGGKAYLRDVLEREGALLKVLRERGVGTKGRPFLMRYNSPFIPGFLRRNEVAVEIEEEEISKGGA